MQFAEQMAKLSDEQRLHFYEVLAHNLTVAIRVVCWDPSIADAEKVDRLKGINEILHSATSKVWVLRLKTHEWSEEDFGSTMRWAVGHSPGIEGHVALAVKSSYRIVAGRDIG